MDEEALKQLERMELRLMAIEHYVGTQSREAHADEIKQLREIQKSINTIVFVLYAIAGIAASIAWKIVW